MEKILVTKEKEELYNIIERITKTREKIILQRGCTTSPRFEYVGEI